MKRAGCMMLVCVLVSCLLPPPRAKAVGGLSFASTYYMNCGNILGTLLLSGSGVDFTMGSSVYNGHTVRGTSNYEMAEMLQRAINSLDATLSEANQIIKDSWNTLVAELQEIGGWIPGHELTIPPELMNYTKEWVAQNYDFSDVISIDQNGIMSSSGDFFQFSQICEFASNGDTKSFTGGRVGTCLSLPQSPGFNTYTFGDYSIRAGYSWSDKYSKYEVMYTFNFSTSSVTDSGWYLVLKDYLDSPVGYSKYVILGYNASNKRVYVGAYYAGTDTISYLKHGWFSAPDILGVSDTMAGTEALAKPVAERVKITIPKTETLTIPGEDDKDIAFPWIGSLGQTDVLTGEGTDNPPIETNPPIVEEGTMVGDIALGDVAAVQGELGAVFITKFPFSIPWDVFRAVKLLLMPAQVPRWEIDLLGPVEQRFGTSGLPGDTTIVIDMSEFPIVGHMSRWLTTFLFCWSLMLGTKRLIWTA